MPPYRTIPSNEEPFLLEKKLASTCQARVSESRFGQGFPKVPEER
jgi:hypothetical protein